MFKNLGPVLLALTVMISAAAVCGESGTTTVSQATATTAQPAGAAPDAGTEKPTAETAPSIATATQPPVAAAPTSTPAAAAPTDTPIPSTPTAPPPPPPTATPVQSSEGLAARVNGQPVPLETYQQHVAQAEAFFIQQQGLDPNSEQGKETLSGVRRQVLEQLIDQALIEQAAQREGVSVSDQQVESTLQGIITGMGQAAFDKSLQDSGMTVDQLKTQLRAQLSGDAVFERITGSLPSAVEQVHARHILLPTREKAQEVLTKLRDGQDFAALAREYSEDPSGQFNDGDLGWFPQGIMAPEFETAAFALATGEVSGIVETQFGFHIVQVLERSASREIPLEMAQAIRQQRFLEWLGLERERATIERFVLSED